MQIPGQGKSTYTKNFKRGVLCNEPLMLDRSPEDTRLERIFTSLQPGKTNSGRGWRHFPVIDSWEGVLKVIVLDELITEAILRRHLEVGGQITGVGCGVPPHPTVGCGVNSAL